MVGGCPAPAKVPPKKHARACTLQPHLLASLRQPSKDLSETITRRSSAFSPHASTWPLCAGETSMSKDLDLKLLMPSGMRDGKGAASAPNGRDLSSLAGMGTLGKEINAKAGGLDQVSCPAAAGKCSLAFARLRMLSV